MDGYGVTVSEAVGLGASFALSGICYYFYVKSRKTLQKLDDAPRFSIDGELKDILKATPGACLQYAVIEGTVQPVDEPLMSYFQKGVGVLQKFNLREHRLVWDRLIQKWLDSEKVLYERVNSVPFALVGPDETAVRVLSPQQASGKHMEMTHEKFHQVNHGFSDIIGQYLSGVKLKGQLETEEMLKVGASLTGVGKLMLDTDGSLTLQPPSDGSEYFLSILDIHALRGEQETKAVGWQVMSIVCALAGTVVLLWVGRRYYYQLRVRREREKEREIFERLRGEVPRAPGIGLGEEVEVENACVICLVQPRDCIMLDCGHVCCCFSCYQALPRRRCPVCMQGIQRVLPLYQV
ncbi:mitochondrial ubiquitin ligase activator of nfkb 1-A [Brachionichthys hirsutus]|uniref:mitochondrial ubiquitin ligase activator of nfkb 1-A n=1 Tax=Brachionichthys hirsutus TaxID=412623 RepID=UPI0036050724